MKGIFIHDHKFPKKENNYFYSYGFDEEFFRRYKNIFVQFDVLGREVKSDEDYGLKNNKIEDDINFFTIKNYKELLNKGKRRYIEDAINRSDALIIRLPSILGLYSIIIANKNNKPYVIELVGCPWDAFWNMGFKKKFVAPFMKYFTKKAVSGSKYTVYVTDKFLQKRYPTKGHSIACSNVTIDSIVDSSLENRLKKLNKLDLNKKIIIGTVGTVDSLYKGQQYVIKAMSKLKKEGYSIEYHLVGGGNQEFLKKVARRNNVTGEVIFYGKIKHSEVFKWLLNIDLYVQPSDTEGLPRSVIEAMSVACPVIGSNAGGIPELIDTSAIFRKGSVDEICNLIKSLTVENMKINAEMNFSRAKNYKKQVLYKRREEFFKSFIENEIEVK